MKKIKGLALAIGTTATVVAPVASVVSCSLFKNSNKSSYEFWNYVDYMNEDTIDKMNKAYNYYEFGDLPELEQALKDEVAIGGVGSDYFNASLAGKGLIAKLDFAKLYGLPQDRTQWRSELSKLYTPSTWKLLTSFELTKMDKNGYPLVVKQDANGDDVTDKDGNPVYERATSATPEDRLIHDVDGDGSDDYLWEYMAPYFVQNKIVGVNIARLYSKLKAKNPTLAAELLTDPQDEKSFKDQVEFEAWFKTQLAGKNATYENIFNKLKELGLTKLSVNNYMRDNLMIGAEALTGSMTGEVKDENTAQTYINAFKSKILNGWDEYQFIDSGVENLQSLIDDGNTTTDGQFTVDTALMYNGDALMAHFGGDDTKVPKGTDVENATGVTRFITPENPTFLLDGIVMAKYAEDDYVELNRFYDSLNTNLFRGALFSVDETDKTNNGLVGDKPSAYTSGNKLYENFDYVNYSAAFDQLDKYISDNYFGDKTDPTAFDTTAEAIYSATTTNVAKVNKDHLTQPINSDLMVKVTAKYNLIVKA